MNPLRVWTGRLLLAVVSLIVVNWVVGRTNAQGPTHTSMVEDWSHRHVVFSQPSSIPMAWKIQTEPRYWMQIIRRNAHRWREERERHEEFRDWRFARNRDQETFQRDWGMPLGNGGKEGNNTYAGFPAKYSFDATSADCNNDFAAFATDLPGVTGGQASIIAYNQLYRGSTPTTGACGTGNPSVFWSYNTNFTAAGVASGATGVIQTSPVLSSDGSKVGFVESRTNANGGSILHLLKWKSGDGGAINTAAAPTIATNWTADSMTNDCPTSGACLISINLNLAPQVTASSPFYDYSHDIMYVGDDSGILHKIINAFGVTAAVPSEVTVGWPITVDSGFILSSPILDSTSGNIFLSDSNGTLSYVRETSSAVGTCATGSKPCLGSTTVTGFAHVFPDAPKVDSSTQKVFVFIGNDAAAASAAIQSDTSLSAHITTSVGSGVLVHVHAGAFDSTYLSGDGSQGFLYVCGSVSTGGFSVPTLTRIGFNNTALTFTNNTGTMDTTSSGALTVAGTTASTECSDITEILNGSTDRIFFSVHNLGISADGCTGSAGCVYSVQVPTVTPFTFPTTAIGVPEAGGTSGIIVDNVGAGGQESNIYFSTLANGTCATTNGCAVKLTQSGLN